LQHNTLQEEYKKNVDLTFNILRIFLAFSNFIEMHSLMSNYRVGMLTMKAVELQVRPPAFWPPRPRICPNGNLHSPPPLHHARR
jgi:hypothetical protein